MPAGPCLGRPGALPGHGLAWSVGMRWEQLSYAEDAQVLGCSANAVGIRVHKAKARMRALLGEETGARRRVAVVRPNGATDGS